MVRHTPEQAASLREPEPAWDIARLFPDQGAWDEADYLALETNHLVEFDNGYIEVLSMPTTAHQAIVQFLSNLLLAFVTAQSLGTVLFAPLRLKIGPRNYREPDILFLLAKHRDRIGNQFWTGADLVVEVVSDSERDRERDLVEKREDYAAAGVAEYWIVDPAERRVTVHTLVGNAYNVAGEYRVGDNAASILLPGFFADVSGIFAAFDQFA